MPARPASPRAAASRSRTPTRSPSRLRCGRASPAPIQPSSWPAARGRAAEDAEGVEEVRDAPARAASCARGRPSRSQRPRRARRFRAGRPAARRSRRRSESIAASQTVCATPIDVPIPPAVHIRPSPCRTREKSAIRRAVPSLAGANELSERADAVPRSGVERATSRRRSERAPSARRTPRPTSDETNAEARQPEPGAVRLADAVDAFAHLVAEQLRHRAPRPRPPRATRRRRRLSLAAGCACGVRAGVLPCCRHKPQNSAACRLRFGNERSNRSRSSAHRRGWIQSTRKRRQLRGRLHRGGLRRLRDRGPADRPGRRRLLPRARRRRVDAASTASSPCPPSRSARWRSCGRLRRVDAELPRRRGLRRRPGPARRPGRGARALRPARRGASWWRRRSSSPGAGVDVSEAQAFLHEILVAVLQRDEGGRRIYGNPEHLETDELVADARAGPRRSRRGRARAGSRARRRPRRLPADRARAAARDVRRPRGRDDAAAVARRGDRRLACWPGSPARRRSTRARTPSEPRTRATPTAGIAGTTHISVVDAAGNAVALSSTLGSGSGVFRGGTQLNNMLGELDVIGHDARSRASGWRA